MKVKAINILDNFKIGNLISLMTCPNCHVPIHVYPNKDDIMICPECDVAINLRCKSIIDKTKLINELDRLMDNNNHFMSDRSMSLIDRHSVRAINEILSGLKTRIENGEYDI